MNDFEQLIDLQEKLINSFSTEEQEQLFIAYQTLVLKRTEKLMTMIKEATDALNEIKQKVANLDA